MVRPCASREAISYRDDSDSQAVQRRTDRLYPSCIVYSAGSRVELLPPESLLEGDRARDLVNNVEGTMPTFAGAEGCHRSGAPTGQGGGSHWYRVPQQGSTYWSGSHGPVLQAIQMRSPRITRRHQRTHRENIVMGP